MDEWPPVAVFGPRRGSAKNGAGSFQSETDLARCATTNHRSRGIASIEAVLFLPLLILIFAGVQLVTRENMALMHARSRARSCAWRISAAGCEKVPRECTSEKSHAETSKSAEDRLQASGALAGTEGSPAVQDKVTSSLDGLLVERNTSTASVSYRRPILLVPKEEQESSDDPTHAERTAEYRLPCNSKPSHAENIAQQLWGELAK